MTLSAVTLTLGPKGPTLVSAPRMPVEDMVIGRPVAEVAELLPRLFNLCRMAQTVAAKLALGLPATEDPMPEIIRDHVLKLCITLPHAFGLPALAVPEPQLLPHRHPAAMLLGPGGLPDDLDDLRGPLVPLFQHLARTFPPGTATTTPLPAPLHPLVGGAFENSAAGRQADHPLLRRIESSHGRGPLWRLAGLLADLDAALAGRLGGAELADGIATVPAARGTYALRLTQSGGLVTGLIRRTPTDHILAPGGALRQSLTRLPDGRRDLAQQVVALHDPCVPVTVREVEDA